MGVLATCRRASDAAELRNTDFNGIAFEDLGDELWKKIGAGNLFMVFGEPYERLKRALHAEIDEVAGASLYSTVSRPFEKPNLASG